MQMSHILWGDSDWYIEADTVQVLIFNVTHDTTLIEEYSCNKQVTETLYMQKDPRVMS